MESHMGASEGPPLRYAMIGCAASIVPTHLRAFAQLPAAQIVGMADINAERGLGVVAQL